MGKIRRHSMLAALVCAIAATPISAATQSQRVQYTASLYGLPVARAVFESRFDGQGFAIAGRFASAGIARIFERTDGTVTVTGSLSGNGSRPREYLLDYQEGTEKKKTTIRFSQGRVTATENQPEPKKRGKDWVPVAKEHLKGVADPLSALLLPASDPAQVCNRTVRVYDGEIRADLVLQPATRGESFAGAAVTCRVRFVPVAGYRKNHSSIVYLRDRGRILIGFGPVEGGKIYSPVEASIATKVGRVHIKARPA